MYRTQQAAQFLFMSRASGALRRDWERATLPFLLNSPVINKSDICDICNRYQCTNVFDAFISPAKSLICLQKLFHKCTLSLDSDPCLNTLLS